MTLSPEQFNKLATKDDLKELKEEMKAETMSKAEFHSVMDVVIKKIRQYRTFSYFKHGGSR